MNKLCNADIHLHTNLSVNCASPEAFVASYLPYCAEEGIEVLGFSNHLYDNLGVEHILKINEELSTLARNTSVKFLVGCEAEVLYGKEPFLTSAMAKKLDYVLLAPSHIFNQMDYYKDFDLSTPDSARKILIENFKQACLLDFGVPTGIAHPLYPIVAPFQQEILDGISEEELRECYTLAAKNEKSIEIHACVYRNTVTLDEEGLSPTYIKMLSLAKQCGCKFHFGSDAHHPNSFRGKHRKLERAAERAGIEKSDLWNIE